MKPPNTITRTELSMALGVSSCPNWVKPIEELLKSTKSDLIKVSEKYLHLIRTECTEHHLRYILTHTNLDLGYPDTAEEFVSSLWFGSKVKPYKNYYGSKFLVHPEYGILFKTTPSLNTLCVSDNIWKVLKAKYGMTDFYDLENYIPCIQLNCPPEPIIIESYLPRPYMKIDLKPGFNIQKARFITPSGPSLLQRVYKAVIDFLEV